MSNPQALAEKMLEHLDEIEELNINVMDSLEYSTVDDNTLLFETSVIRGIRQMRIDLSAFRDNLEGESEPSQDNSMPGNFFLTLETSLHIIMKSKYKGKKLITEYKDKTLIGRMVCQDTKLEIEFSINWLKFVNGKELILIKSWHDDVEVCMEAASKLILSYLISRVR